MRNLLDANFYSVLYYNSVIWLTPDLKTQTTHNLFAISANALKSCVMIHYTEISFENIHKVNGKFTPTQIMTYQASLKPHKMLNALLMLLAQADKSILKF